MVRLSLLSLALTLLGGLALVEAQASNDDPTGKTLYITEPACGFYKCTVTWRKGESVAVNWLGPPKGKVTVQLMSNTNGPTYTIAASYPGTSQEGYCDGGNGLGVVTPGVECGRIEFIVPGGWTEMNNYTIAVTSLSDSNLVGYTDSITIAAANSSTSGDVPSGTAASIITIPGPTTTNLQGSTSFTGDIPSPTAMTVTRTTTMASVATPTSAASSSAATPSSAAGTTAASPSTSSAAPSASSSAAPRTSGARSVTFDAVWKLATASSFLCLLSML